MQLHIVPVVPAEAMNSPVEGQKLSIEERLAQLAAQVPQEVWDELPKDLSQNIDLNL